MKTDTHELLRFVLEVRNCLNSAGVDALIAQSKSACGDYRGARAEMLSVEAKVSSVQIALDRFADSLEREILEAKQQTPSAG